jgi:hypothetical protein
MIDPDHFDVEEYLAAVQGILGGFPKRLGADRQRQLEADQGLS